MDHRYNLLVTRARELEEKQKYDEAIKLYEEAFQIMIVFDDLIALGLLYLDNKMPLKAKSAFNAIVSTFPEAPQGYYGLGLVYEALNKANLAHANYLQTIQKDHTFAQAYFNLALLEEDNNNEKIAYDYYKKTLLYEPNHFWANLNIGSFYEKNDYLDLALEHTQRAYSVNPDKKMVTFNLGVIYARLKDYDKALKYYLEELKKPDCYFMTHLNIALIYKDIYNDYNQSRYYLLDGISRFKDNTALWYNLACLYALLNDYKNTTNCLYYAIIKKPELEQRLKIDPELKEYRNNKEYEILIRKVRND